MLKQKILSFKQKLRPYGTIWVVTTAFLVLLLVFILLRVFTLYSIQDISSINPLITNQNSQLVLSDGSTGALKLPNGTIQVQKTDDTTDNNKTTESKGSSTQSTQPTQNTPAQTQPSGTTQTPAGGGSTPTQPANLAIKDIIEHSVSFTASDNGISSCYVTGKIILSYSGSEQNAIVRIRANDQVVATVNVDFPLSSSALTISVQSSGRAVSLVPATFTFSIYSNSVTKDLVSEVKTPVCL